MKKSHAARKKVAISRDYLTALQAFWAGRPHTAIEHLSQSIVDHADDHPNLYCLYRLWIEILAEQNEHNAMRVLCEHFSQCEQTVDEQERVNFQALQGLAHFAADEYDAASYLADATKHCMSNIYCLELQHVVSQRLTPARVHSRFLSQAHIAADYYSLSSMALYAYQSGKDRVLAEVCGRIKKLYKGAPLIDWFGMHQALKRRNFAKAYTSAMSLADKFPGNVDHGVAAAFAALKSKDQDANTFALRALEKARNINQEDPDPDLYYLLGIAYKRRFEANGHTNDAKKAEDCFNVALQTLEGLGVSAVWPRFQINKLQTKKREKAGAKGEDTMVEQQSWMIKLNAAEYYELRNNPTPKLQHVVRPLAHNARPGDLVFMMGNDYVGEDMHASWRIGAVFMVGSEPSWHPLNGYECVLSLVSRPQASIPLDVRNLHNKKVDQGIIHLDGDSLDLISDAIRDHREGDQSSVFILEELKRMSLSS